MKIIITKRGGETMSEKAKKPIYKRWWFITIAVSGRGFLRPLWNRFGYRQYIKQCI